MSLLITETVDHVDVIEEATSSGKKAMYLTGVFMESGIVNRNGRRYPQNIMENEVNRYINEKVNKSCAYGELNHPSGPSIDLKNACILIKELKLQPNGQVIGKARVTETDVGRTVKGLIESGANLGVSSRGLGSLKEVNGIKEVQEDFHLVTASDVVADPSAPNAFVNGIMEGVEWIWNEKTGEFAKASKQMIDEVYKHPKHLTEEVKSVLFARFLKSL